MCGAGAEVNAVALAPISDAYRDGAPLVADTYGSTTWQPRMRSADAPVLICLAAVGGAAVIPRIVDGGSGWPSGCWHRQQQQQAGE